MWWIIQGRVPPGGRVVYFSAHVKRVCDHILYNPVIQKCDMRQRRSILWHHDGDTGLVFANTKDKALGFNEMFLCVYYKDKESHNATALVK